jgi:hypothetical protein
MRAGCGADDTASMPGRDNRYVMYMPKKWEAPTPIGPQKRDSRTLGFWGGPGSANRFSGVPALGCIIVVMQ